MKTVAVVLAQNPQNCGMYSVDLTALSFFERLGISPDLFCPIGDEKNRSKELGKLSINYLHSIRELDSYDYVIYWGDFTTNPAYGINDFANRDVRLGGSANREAAIRRWKDIHIGEKPTGQICISASQNFQNLAGGNTFGITDYVELFFDRFDYVLPRDPISMEAIQKLAPKNWAGQAEQGIDAAYMLSGLERGAYAEKMKARGYFVCFFHRSKLENIGALTGEISRKTGLVPVYLDRWLNAPLHEIDDYYFYNIGLIKNSSFVISDTYHVCVNSFNCQVPVFGIGIDEGKMLGTLGDFKKKILFEMHCQDDNYTVFKDRVMHPRKIDIILEKIYSNLGDAAKSYAFLAGQKKAYEQRLRDIFSFSDKGPSA
ncbi:polysaccharide pyruvyl transferase family protein [Halovulum sp. GXIMD14793]